MEFQQSNTHMTIDQFEIYLKGRLEELLKDQNPTDHYVVGQIDIITQLLVIIEKTS